MITQRQIQTLDNIIRQYIRTAEPVGSEDLSFKKMKISSATIRNEMQELEKSGYLSHPHTSAGRVPTEKGYDYFIKNLMGEYNLEVSEQNILKRIERNYSFENTMKQKAKLLSKLTSEAVILSFGKESLFYTGLTNLFSKPEFKEIRLVVSFSEILDKLDEAIQELFKQNFNDIKILIGSKNPFGQECGAIVGNYKKDDKKGIVGILGPMRMDYEKNLAFLNYIFSQIN